LLDEFGDLRILAGLEIRILLDALPNTIPHRIGVGSLDGGIVGNGTDNGIHTD